MIVRTIRKPVLRANLGTLNPFQSKFVANWFLGRSTCAMAGWGAGKSRLIATIMAMQHEFYPGEDGAYLTRDFKKAAPISNEIGALLIPLGWVRKATLNQTPMPHWESPRCPKTGRITRVFVLNYKRAKGQSVAANSVEGPDLGWLLIDEANLFPDDEVARNAFGRVRSGVMPRLGILGKPTYGAWWLRWAREPVRDPGEWTNALHSQCDVCNGHLTVEPCTGCGWRTRGVAFKAPSKLNRLFLPNYERWRADMSPRERAQNLDCVEMMPDGAVYASWNAEAWPNGNLTPPGWNPREMLAGSGRFGARTVVAMDFGQRAPAAVVMSYDKALDAWVMWSEAAPDGASVAELVGMLRAGIVDIGAPGIVPRHRASLFPNSVPCAEAYGDIAGNAKRDDDALSSPMSDFSRPLDAGGFGLLMTPSMSSPKPERRGIAHGVRMVDRLILSGPGGKEKRRLLMWAPLWRWGLAQKHRTMAKALVGYEWHGGSGDVPRKDGVNDHHCDALRYGVACVAWGDSTPVGGVVMHTPTPIDWRGMVR